MVLLDRTVKSRNLVKLRVISGLIEPLNLVNIGQQMPTNTPLFTGA